MKINKKCVIIPCYEPPHSLIDYVKDLTSSGIDKILIVNDGSGADFEKVFSTLKQIDNVIVLDYEKNMGKGYALKHAFKFAVENFDNSYVFATADCDGQHLTIDVLKCLEVATLNENAFILGYRDFNDNEVPPRSAFGNKSTILVFKLLFNLKYKDTQTGLRAFSYDLLEKLINIDGNRFEYETNELVDIPKSNIKIIEVPIATVYQKKTDDVNRRSHFKTFSDSYKVWNVLIKKAKLKSLILLTPLLLILIIILLII